MARSFAEKYVRDLAVTIRKVVPESLWNIRKDQLARQLLAIGERCASLPDIDRRNADDILGYDEQGLPQ